MAREGGAAGGGALAGLDSRSAPRRGGERVGGVRISTLAPAQPNPSMGPSRAPLGVARNGARPSSRSCRKWPLGWAVSETNEASLGGSEEVPADQWLQDAFAVGATPRRWPRLGTAELGSAASRARGDLAPILGLLAIVRQIGRLTRRWDRLRWRWR